MKEQAKILIVDDEPFNIDYLEQELEDLDYQLVSAEQGCQALAKVEVDAPDVILLDIMMPEMDGFQVLDHLKGQAASSHIPVIIISAMDDMASVVRGIELGAEDYLPKPFDPVLLKARIGACVERKLLRDREMMYLRQVEQEMELAWRVQSGLLPDHLPELPGWQLAATLTPSRKTSGDFYDLIPLPDGKFGLLIADVVGKGMGAALYMALSRTLIRTFAVQHHPNPDRVLEATNQRLLADIGAAQFVTVFYGILDPANGVLRYGNAGHNPPLLLTRRQTPGIHPLSRTGMILGVFETGVWEQETVEIAPGEALVLYTDGIVEAQNAEGALFTERRLFDLMGSCHGQSAHQIQEALLTEVQHFVGDTAQTDDITCVILDRCA